ncbi:hypothetical protein CRM83_04820 [Escherichia coli]|nr:hypothetical protein AAF13_08285 [Escherichia coli O104:H4 str. C227-11]ATG10405.1 hypothetical protein CO706_05625 [Escherichia coli]AVL29572.1 hypothetical protein CEQ27_04465 [Escherichia coli O104:H4]EGT68300.1 hypothetical protein C22711_2330 [Escherichia coli O104:H4 str. C227-11]KPO69255.1 hypothetical protein ACU80_19700 [Escherichia coli]
MTNLINIKNRLVIHYLRTIYYEKNYIHPAGSIFAAIQKNESLLKFPSIISMLNINLLFNPLNLPGMGSGVLEDIMSIPDSSLREGANKRGNSSRLTQSFHFFMFEPIFSPVNALNQPI